MGRIFKIILKTIMFSFLVIVVVTTAAVLIFIRQHQFGHIPTGERLSRVERSPNYRNGSFQNLNPTPDLTEGVSYYAVIKEFLFTEKPRLKPIDSIPSTKTDLLNLDPSQDILVWFGHSSYFIQVDGKKILVDPVLSGAASPVSFTTKAFIGSDAYTTDDIPEIDYLFISHDHWDHVDYETLQKLKSKIKNVMCGLGTGEHFEYWGYDKSIIHEEDWNVKIELDSGFTAYTVPARHFSGRAFARNKALWTSFVFKTPTMQFFFGGDSGYDTHFAKIGETYGNFDVVILENGQYDKSWKYIHMMPDEVLQAAKDLNAKTLFPVHSSKFVLANHAWDDPLKQITEFNKTINMPLLTPIIGEQVNLKDSLQTFPHWWTTIN
ncbi:MAG: MBL fold metallo-hydrolase [Marivirga sp.]|nr:MBL fold metallo-hydrolase [Marivirga sp.]